MRVLIQCGNNLENSRRVLSISSLLRDHGVQPVVAVYNKEYTGFFSSAGIQSLPFFDARPLAVTSERIGAVGFKPDAADIFALEVLRSKLAGAKFDIRKNTHMMNRTMIGLDEIVKGEGIDSLLVWNGHTGLVANVWRVYKEAKGIPGGYMERGLLPDGVFFDPIGTNGDASIARGSSSAEGMPSNDYRERHAAAIETLIPSVERELFLKGMQQARTKTIFVPLQVQSDSNIILHSPRLKSMRKLVLQAIYIRDHFFPDYSIVVRPHPEESPDVVLNIPLADRLVIKRDGTLSEALCASEITITINSTVGLEAALQGSLPVVLGEGIYCQEPFVVRLLRHQDGGIVVDRLKALKSAPEVFHDQLMQYLAHYFDMNQVQPVYRRLSEPLGLLEAIKRDNAGASSTTTGTPKPSATEPFTAQSKVFSAARAHFQKQAGPISCDAFDLDTVKLIVNYRKTSHPPDRATIAAMLNSLLGIDASYTIRPQTVAKSGDIAIVPAAVSFTGARKYRLVLDEHFGLHKNFVSQF
ncbi:hypothetical protein HFC70_04890 [Agrobacterium sp. a22-2]|uniref:capsular polysaccharide export protein, LipB/KpsS family n=1 Tax=Agrobacterium sp. a22-2 TaxID=2283840 RepID=UPI0014472C9C|nr:hypothetical protein [Agrobacterium sp. a22-2]NKN35688.1 hypothetical protein [Agrobacterium sp. a22-2]